ncbi:MAG: sulfite exporter TauE/SafE family protein [Oligoflexia bacterium]|nr:sulfite exporter TauE/SafE family protein [Oligoflexia bacterium]
MSFSFLGAFGAGLLTFLSPCVLPLAPILTASLIVSDSNRLARLRSTLWFAVGFSAVFVVMGLGIGALSRSLGDAKPVLLAIAGLVLALFGLRMMGLIDTRRFFAWMERSVHLPDFSRRIPRGLHGLLFGALFGLSWTPCVGPVLGGILTYVASQERTLLEGAALLFSFALGIALPLVAIALASERMTPLLGRLKKFLPRIEYATGLGVFVFAVVILNQARMESPNLFKHAPDKVVGAVSDSGKFVGLGEETANVGRMVFFYSENCPVCHAMDAYLPGFERNCASDNLEVIRVNIDRRENQGAARRFAIKAVPTVSILNDQGVEIAHLVGYQMESRLRDAAKRVTGLVCRGDSVDLPAPGGKTECDVGKAC